MGDIKTIKDYFVLDKERDMARFNDSIKTILWPRYAGVKKKRRTLKS